MANHNQPHPRDKEDNSIVDALLGLPVRSLEARIKKLEKEIASREELSWVGLSELGTQRLRLEDRLEQLKYVGCLGPFQTQQQALHTQIIRVRDMEIQEKVVCFRDVGLLKERLQEASEELESDRQRLTLIASADQATSWAQPGAEENQNEGDK